MDFTEEELKKEIWKDIPNYVNLYKCSNLGRVKSLARQVKRSNGVLENREDRILSEHDNGKGYKCVQLYNKSGNKRFYIHRLVMLTFEGDSTLVVDHIDNNKSNNKLENLRYLSQRKNTTRNIKSISNYTGVSINNKNKYKKWRSSIRILDKRYFLGSYLTEKEASIAYNKALFDWENFNKTPEGEIIKDKESKIFNSKSKGLKGKNRKPVIDIETGIKYDSLKEASKNYPQSYKYLSNAILYKPEKTTLRYIESNEKK